MRTLVSTLISAVVLAAAAPAGGQEATPLAPYDGRNPFKCDPQDVGTGVDYPSPDADPLCVIFDKTNQDIEGLGLLDFLGNEPARVEAARDKCFYFQRDHWRGSLLAGGGLETYHWRGSYFFDLARGAGAAYVKRVRLLGSAGDPSYVDHVPEPFQPFVHPTGGGGFVRFDYPADPRCTLAVNTRSERRATYRRWYRAGPREA